MFSLIITIIVVSLIVVLIAATMYYGGNSIIVDANAEVQVARTVGEVEQFKTAMQIYKLDHGVAPTGVDQLLAKDYLAAIPDGWGASELQLANINVIASKIDGSAEQAALQCEKINQKLNISTVPLCTEIASDFAGCCKTA